MKRLFLLLPLLMLFVLCGCGDKWEITPEETIFLRTVQPEEGDLYIECINGAGEIRYGYSSATPLPAALAEIRALEPARTLEPAVLETLTGHLRKINKNARFLYYDGPVPAALTERVSYYAIIDGEEILLQSEYWEPDRLNDRHAMAAVALHKEWEASWPPAATKPVSTERLLFKMQIMYEEGERTELFHYFCIKENGEVWTMNSDGQTEDSFRFRREILNGDAEAFSLAEDVRKLGYLPEETLRELRELLQSTDPAAGGEETQVRPDVEDTLSYSAHCFIPAESGLAKLYLQSGGDNSGVRYRTDSPSGLSLLRLVQECDLYQAWYKSLRTVHIPDEKTEEQQGFSVIPTAAPEEEPPAPGVMEADETFYEAAFDEMEAVDDAIDALMNSAGFSDLTTEEKAEQMLDLLISLAEHGTKALPYPLILRSSIYYDGDDMISFIYACDALGGVKLKPFDPMMN